MSTETWTEERIERAKELWDRGYSAAQIARYLSCGLSRNAVIGKLHRMGLLGSRGDALSQRRPGPRVSAPKPKPKPPLKPVVVEKPALTPDGKIITLMDLNDTMCKWPIGDPQSPDFHFCGRPTQGTSPYCEAHTAMAHQPPKTRAQARAERVKWNHGAMGR